MTVHEQLLCVNTNHQVPCAIKEEISYVFNKEEIIF